ncbi:MAG TPA: hypothetical protein VG496_17790 [Myxococcales bacterium]|nr:hypothetical protein [Myxococcales bacterium]
MRKCLRFIAVGALLAACGSGFDAFQRSALGSDGGIVAAPDAGAPPPSADAGTPADGGPQQPGDTSCLARLLLSQLSRPLTLLVGADMDDSIAASAPFDVRYLYLAGGLADGDGTCASCGACTAAGASCSGSSGCDWWGCWQDPSVAPGQYVRDLLAKTASRGMLPMISYYEVLQSSGVAEGPAEISALQNVQLTTRWFNDFRFVLRQIGATPALLHLEPDLWGYAEQMSPDPTAIPAAVTLANPLDCSGQQDSFAGFGRCAISMVRKYAANARVGLHASAWASGIDGTNNRDPSVDMVANAQRVGDFLLACGAADGDFVVVEASDRDAGYYRSLGVNTFWDADNATLPSFHQAFTWAAALTERIGRPALWWQLPLGNMSLPDVPRQWQDNRVDYLFAHPDEVAKTNAFGMVFGAGDSQQTTPSTDGGNLVRKVLQFVPSRGQLVCP